MNKKQNLNLNPGLSDLIGHQCPLATISMPTSPLEFSHPNTFSLLTLIFCSRFFSPLLSWQPNITPQLLFDLYIRRQAKTSHPAWTFPQASVGLPCLVYIPGRCGSLPESESRGGRESSLYVFWIYNAFAVSQQIPADQQSQNQSQRAAVLINRELVGEWKEKWLHVRNGKS